jgi:replication factor C large subunit
MPWVEKHRPKSFNDIKGQDKAIEKIKEFLINSKKKALILSGAPGTGKTTLALVAAKENKAELFELNASDFRNKEKLNEILKPVLEQKSLIDKGKIILIDEVDGISAVDRGGLPELLRLIETSTYPIIITANNIWDQKFSALRKKCEHIELQEIPYITIKKVLIEILRKENKFLDNEVLTRISINAKGDLRASINDLETTINLENPFETELSTRDKQETIFQAMKFVLQTMPSKDTISTFDKTNLHIDDVILWMEKNIPKEYSGKELERAFDLLSKTDVFRGRIYKQQYWRFLVYENFFLSYGISSAKKQPKTKYVSYEKPSRILQIWLNNQKTAKIKTIAEKYARLTHIGQKRAMHEFPIIKQIINSNPEIKKQLKLNEEEIEYLNR